jgi:hypothetical protein
MYGPAAHWVVRLDLEGDPEVLWESESTWVNWPVPPPDDPSLVFHALRLETDIWVIEGF